MISVEQIHSKLTAWYRLNAKPLPWRNLWTEHRDPWHIWVSEVMLQQTVISVVIPVYHRFLIQFPTAAHLAATDSETVRLAVRGLGYYRRFDLLHKATKTLVSDLKGHWPRDFESWKALPGVGDYTASAIASITLDLPHGVVDGNVERVMCRLLDIRSAPNLPHLKKHFKSLMDLLTRQGDPGSLNQSVMELGQNVCTPTKPKCEICPITKNCLSFAHQSQHLAPGPKPKKVFREIKMVIAVPIAGHQISLQRRTAKAHFLKGTLGFPTFLSDNNGKLSGDGFEAPQWMIDTLQSSGEPPKDAAKTPVKSPSKIHPNLKFKPKVIKHNITDHKIVATVVPIKFKDPDFFEVKISKKEADAALVSNLDRKALKAAMEWDSRQ
ncbi:MAG: hypothetical protein NTV34_08045 [Proteobacteria bacterium]|nr:hypothetical protein [Pseudomonadota bacterium]